MVTKWLVQQEQWAAEQGQRHADLVSFLWDTDWDDWAWMDRRGSRVWGDLGFKRKRVKQS